MLENGWVHQKALALTANYVVLDFGSAMRHMKLRASAVCQLSWNGVDDDGEVLLADGLTPFPDIMKGKIYFKGTGTVDITAWDGN